MVCTHCPIAVAHFHWTIINKSDLESKSCLSNPEISVLHFIVKSFLQLKRYCSIFQRSNECFYRYPGRNLFTIIKHPECQILSFKLHWAGSSFHTNDGATDSGRLGKKSSLLCRWSLKWTVSVISSELQFKDRHPLFTTVPFKLCTKTRC